MTRVDADPEAVVDPAYSDPRLAALYDTMNPWGPDDDYYLALIRTARSVLDLGCGTGQLLRRAAADGHPGVLVGVDPAEAMLAQAKREADTVDWRLDDARTVDIGHRFDLVIMTGHAFQELLTDEDVRMVLSNVRRHLRPGGRFAFETRNPAYRAWERWAAERSATHVGPDGQRVEVEFSPSRTIDPDLVEFSATVRFADASDPLASASTIRFIDPERLRTLLEEEGFHIDGWYGDWDRTPVTDSSPEVIVVATRPG
jgi:SAM-dependent methyltransferase